MSAPLNAISGITSNIPSISSDMTKSVFAKPEVGGGFDSVFTSCMNKVNTTMNATQELGDKIATGDVGSLHQVSIAEMKSKIMLQLTTQIAAKLSSAASTLFQMQM